MYQNDDASRDRARLREIADRLEAHRLALGLKKLGPRLKGRGG